MQAREITGIRGGRNLYGFVANRPAEKIDVNGQSYWPCTVEEWEAGLCYGWSPQPEPEPPEFTPIGPGNPWPVPGYPAPNLPNCEMEVISSSEFSGIQDYPLGLDDIGLRDYLPDGNPLHECMLEGCPDGSTRFCSGRSWVIGQSTPGAGGQMDLTRRVIAHGICGRCKGCCEDGDDCSNKAYSNINWVGQPLRPHYWFVEYCGCRNVFEETGSPP